MLYERFQRIKEANGLFFIVLTFCVQFKRKGALTAGSTATQPFMQKEVMRSIRAMFVRNFQPFHIMYNVPRNEQGS